MDLLIALLCIAILLGLGFWLLGIILGGIPGAPAWLRSAILGIFALVAFVDLFGGYPPFSFRDGRTHWGMFQPHR
jgi:hypothetical protein